MTCHMMQPLHEQLCLLSGPHTLGGGGEGDGGDKMGREGKGKGRFWNES